MSRRRRLLIGVAGGLGLFLTLLVVAAVVVSRFVDLTALRRHLLTQLSEHVQGDFDLQKLRLSFFPAPHFVLEGVSLSIPGLVEGTIESVSFYPRVLAFVRGQMKFDRLQITAPAIRLQLPREMDSAHGASSASAGATVKGAVTAALAAASSLAAAESPGVVVSVEQAQLRVSTSEREFLFTHLDAQAHLSPSPSLWSLELHCASDLWESVSLSATLDASTVVANGQIDMVGFRPQALGSSLLPAGAPQLGDATVNLAVRIATHGLDAWQAHVDASTPSLPLQSGDSQLTIRNANLKGTLTVNQHTVQAAVQELQLEYPRLRLSGKFFLDDVTPLAKLDLEASDLDVAAVRDAGLQLVGNIPVTRDIFDILRGGQVPQFSLHTQAPSVANLGGPDSLVIRGRLVDGRINVAGLDLEDVVGDATITQNVLVGEQLSGRLGKSRAHDGSLRVGLSGTAPELFLETLVDADAAQLPPLLKPMLAGSTLSQELDRISAIEGTASGKLILGGTTKNVTTTVEVAPFKVSGRFEGLRDPLQIEGGRFLYTGRGIEATDLQVSAGGSTLSQVSMQMDWSQPRSSLQASCGTSRVVLEDIYPWVVASGWLGTSTANPKALSGTVVVDSLFVNGPADKPSDWMFELIGAAQNFEIDAPLLRERIAIRHPVSLPKVRLARDGEIGLSFSGQVAAPDGLTGSLDLVWNPYELNVKRLTIHDAESDASLSLLSKAREIFLTFAGNLTKGTLSKVVPNHHLLNGWVRGKFRTRIVSDHPGRSTAEGKLEARDAFVPLHGDRRVHVERVTLAATAGTVSVDAAIEATAGSPLHLQGRVQLSPQAFRADLDVSAGALDWDLVETFLPRTSTEAPETGTPSPNPPLRGTVRVTADSFTYAGFTWRPLRASVSLSAHGPIVRITQANVCGIATPGKISVTPPEIALAFQPVAKSQQLDSVLACLFNEKQLVTGLFGLTGEINAHGRPGTLGQSLNGEASFDSKNGRVYRLKLMTGVFNVLSVASGAVWNLPDLTKEGLLYNTVALRATVQGGKLVLNEAVMDGPSMKMVAEGSINLFDQTVDLTLLVAPLKTVDTVVSWIPVLGGVLGGSLITIPVKVTGRFGDPKVTPLQAAAVGEGLLRVMKRTVMLPMRVVDLMLPGEKK